MWLRSDDFSHDGPIPDDNAFCLIDPDTHVRFGPNLSPHVEWGDVPDGTESFALLFIDVDVPTSGVDVNQEGREVPSDLARTDFTHWALVDIDPTVTIIERGAFSNGVTRRGKEGRAGRPKEGVNDYTGWFEGDADMEGTYKGYDGPCPPWNDSIIHHYHMTVYALDIPTLELTDDFTGPDVREAMGGHVLDQANIVGTYTLNPRLAGDQ